MRCPQCNWQVWERYDKNDEDIWVREILCPICHYHDTIEVSEEETLEEFAERMSQRIQHSVRFDIFACFRNRREYTDGYLLEDKEGNRIHVDITIKPEDSE
jgi:hypothetical protein